MSEVTNFLKDNLHVPLKENTSSHEAIELMNGFYGTKLISSDYKLTHTYRSLSGYLELELIKVNESEGIVIVNHNSFREEDNLEISLKNPLESEEGMVFLDKPLLLSLPEELDFFTWESGKDFPLLINKEEEDSLIQLRTIFEKYVYLGPWYLGSLHEYSLTGIKVIYNGSVENLPKEIGTVEGTRVLIIELTHGFNKGHVCLIT